MLADAATEAARVATIADEKFKAGSAPRVEVLRTGADRERARADASLAAALVPAAAARLAIAVGPGGGQARVAQDWVATGKPELALADLDLAALQRGVAEHPILRWDRARIAAGAAHVRAEQRARWPTVTGDLTVNWRDPTLPATDVIAGIAFEAPVLSLRGGAIARARAEQKLAETTAETEQRRLAAALVDALGRAGGAGERSRTLATAVLPALDQAWRMNEEGYRDGRVDLLRLLDAQRCGSRRASRWSRRKRPGSGRWRTSSAPRVSASWAGALVRDGADRRWPFSRACARSRPAANTRPRPSPNGGPFTARRVETTDVTDVLELRGTVAPLPDRDARSPRRSPDGSSSCWRARAIASRGAAGGARRCQRPRRSGERGAGGPREDARPSVAMPTRRTRGPSGCTSTASLPARRSTTPRRAPRPRAPPRTRPRRFRSGRGDRSSAPPCAARSPASSSACPPPRRAGRRHARDSGRRGRRSQPAGAGLGRDGVRPGPDREGRAR